MSWKWPKISWSFFWRQLRVGSPQAPAHSVDETLGIAGGRCQGREETIQNWKLLDGSLTGSRKWLLAGEPWPENAFAAGVLHTWVRMFQGFALFRHGFHTRIRQLDACVLWLRSHLLRSLVSLVPMCVFEQADPCREFAEVPLYKHPQCHGRTSLWLRGARPQPVPHRATALRPGAVSRGKCVDLGVMCLVTLICSSFFLSASTQVCVHVCGEQWGRMIVMTER